MVNKDQFTKNLNEQRKKLNDILLNDLEPSMKIIKDLAGKTSSKKIVTTQPLKINTTLSLKQKISAIIKILKGENKEVQNIISLPIEGKVATASLLKSGGVFIEFDIPQDGSSFYNALCLKT